MTSLDAICGHLASLAPLRLAEDWDNVGLLVGDRKSAVTRIMTCLTVTPNVVDEAVRRQADLVVTHHPIPFKPLPKITSDSVTGSMLLKLIQAGVAVYSAHTAFDSALQGINAMWCQRLGVEGSKPLIELTPQQSSDSGQYSDDPAGSPIDASSPVGAGRYGRLTRPQSLASVVQLAADAVHASAPRIVGDKDREITKVAFACGSGGSFLAASARQGCDLLITGEATFHTCLEAEARGIGLGLLGHYFSERFAMESLAQVLAAAFPELTVWPSEDERDPLQTLVLSA